MLLEFDRTASVVPASSVVPNDPSRCHAARGNHHTPQAHAVPDLIGRRVLVLDDDPLAAIIATLDLEDAGASFALVHCAASALRELDRAARDGAPYDAAVLDVNLGGGETSHPVADRLRADRVPFVFHTADREVDARNAPMVSKPAVPGALARALASVIAEHHEIGR